MPETDLNNVQVSALASNITAYSVNPIDTDASQNTDETTWQNTEWSQQLGYYKTIPELQTAIDAKVNWTMGSGYDSADEVTLILDLIRGMGKDSFNSIMSNMLRTYTIAGDAFAEIIRNDDELIVNLKPIDPGSMRIVSNKKGRIKRYEQTEKVGRETKVVAKFKPEEIFHLSRKRIADEVHGISVITACEQIILMRNEAMQDWKRVLHRNVEPLWVFHLDTDDTSTIEAMKAKYNSARKNGENMFIPKGTVVPELITTSANANLNPLTWINQLNDYFFQAVNVPQIIIGNAKEFTDASGKIVYLSYEQSVKGEQLYVEEQILAQLGFEIKWKFPASLQGDLISGQQKQPMTSAVQPSDVSGQSIQ